MNLYQKLSLALTQCDLPPLKHKIAYRKIGAGAWHDAYLVYPRGAERLVVRLRKTVIYGREERFDKISLREDYEPVGLYYRWANQAWPGICPTVYDYRLSPDLTFTIESYMGPALALPRLTAGQAFAYGQQVGQFFRAMHAQPPPFVGFGAPVWQDTLVAKDQRTSAEVWQAEIADFYAWFEQLSQIELSFDRATVKAKLDEVLAERPLDAEPVALVNGDITPENLITRRGHFIGLIDPVPMLHNGLRYAAFFLYCYRSYLPNLADAPRYAHHQFQHVHPQMLALADGYAEGYAQGQPDIRRNLQQEYFLWTVDVAYECLQRLNAETTPELYLRAGDRSQMAARLQRCIEELAALAVAT